MIQSHRSESVTARAPGNVNVCFRVGTLQPDGSHTIATLYQAVSLFDSVTATQSNTFSVEVIGETQVPGGDRNLAMRAAKLLARAAQYPGGVHLEIDKQIPRGSGMSGGSADAAAALVACNELWRLQFDRNRLKMLALELGADVPFALEGGTAVGTGRGDEFSQALSVGTYHWVIVPSDERLGEIEVVQKLDEHRDEHRDDLGEVPDAPLVDTAVLQAVRSGNPRTVAEAMRNDLQMASLRLADLAIDHMELGEAQGALAGITLTTTATIAFLMEDARGALELQATFEGSGVTALVVEGPVAGASVVESAERRSEVLR